MYSNKQSKSKRNHKRNKKQRSFKKKVSFKNRRRISGGQVFFGPTYNAGELGPNNNYDLNTYTDDPSNLPNITATRNLATMTGGKMKSTRMKQQKKMKKSRKMKGGLAPYPAAGFNSSGSSILNYSPYDVPINVPYGTHNPALI